MILLLTPIRWVNLLLAMATLLAYMAPMVDPNSTTLFSLIGQFFPFMLIAHVGFIIFWAILRKRILFFSLLTLLLGWNHVNAYFCWFPTGSPASLAVFTCNIHGFGEATPTEWTDRIRNIKADILLLQEVPLVRGEGDKMDAPFRKQGYGHVLKGKKSGQVIYSKYPIAKSGTIDFEKSGNGAIWADIEGPKGRFRVYNLHLQSNRVSVIAEELSTTKDVKEKQIKDAGRMFKLYHRAVVPRARQVNKVLKHALASPYPVLLGGDCNDPPMSWVYGQLSAHYKDSFVERGTWGWGSTYKENLPFLRIDYLWASPQWHVGHHAVITDVASDHNAVVASFELIGGVKK